MTSEEKPEGDRTLWNAVEAYLFQGSAPEIA